MNREQLQKRLAQLEAELEKAKAQTNMVLGAIILVKEILATMPEVEDPDNGA